jgi:membrane protein YdbS with pleckstrin-like domain
MATSPQPAPSDESVDALVESIAESVRLPQLRIERRAIWWWVLRAVSRWGVLLGVLVAASVIWDAAAVWLVAPIGAVAAILLAKVAVEPWWRYSVHRWEIGEHATYAVTGCLVREWRVAPTSRIQTVDAVRGPFEQMLGLSTLRVTTASSSGAITISGLDRATADEAVMRLAAVAEITPGDAT